MPAAKVRYDGSACLNVRSVLAACETLRGGDCNAAPLRWPELSNALWFIETCVTSKKLYFDGTVPRETAERAVEQVGLVKRAGDLELFDVAPIRLDTSPDILEAARDAAAESRLLISQLAVDGSVDTPLPPAEHERFYQDLLTAKLLAERSRRDLMLEWVSDAFRGSKCLAAIVANGDEMLDAVIGAYERHAGREAWVSAALINRFRLNYVNELASRCRSAYVPAPNFEVLTREHIRLFKDYLLERVVKKLDVPAGETNLLVENMRAETPLPPIGLYALMATRAAKRPGAILETAYNEFRADDGLMRVIWNNTRGGMSVQQDGSTAIEDYFYDRYKELEKQAEGIRVLTRKRSARTYLIPAILKGLAKAIPEALGVGKAWEVVYAVLKETASEVAIPFVSDKLLEDGCDSYISQYKSLKWDLRNDDAVTQPLARLSDHVEKVFGRPLVLA
jgi:hypothetical protein